MTVLMVQPEFWSRVLDGSKDRTLRAPRKRPIKIGDKLSLRRWTGRPYASKQEVLREVVCCLVAPVVLHADGAEGIFISVAGLPIPWHAVDAWARTDGFDSAKAMREWFQRVHGLPAILTMIRWNP